MKYLTLLIFFSWISLFAQSEFIVNTTLTGVQRDPQIARDAAGNYAVVWKSEAHADPTSRGDIVLRFFNAGDSAVSEEILVNTVTEGDQDKPAIAMNARGDLVVAWASFTGFDELYDIKARIYINRAPASEEFLVNTTTLHTQTNPAVAIDDSGTFIVAWDSWFQDGGDRGVYACLFDANGTPASPEFRVNQTTAYSQAKPGVKIRGDGSFVVVWESWKQDIVTPSGYGVFGRIFNADGSARTNEFQVNTYTNDYQWFGDLEVFDDNSFAVVWCSWEQDGDDGGIYAQRFDAQGIKTGTEELVNKTTVNYQWLPKIRKLSGGGFAVAWSSWKQDGDREGVYARLFDETNRAVSFETQVNQHEHSFQWEPDFVVTPDDGLLVVWSSWGQTGNDYDVVARRVTPIKPQGFIRQPEGNKTSGRSTTQIFVHVVDSTALTGETYDVSFDSLGTERFSAHVVKLATGDTVVSAYPLDRGSSVFYLTPPFDGVALEIVPEFSFDIDYGGSSFVNHSGTNLLFQVDKPTAGVWKL
ncbi:MAG: hypothetical protein ACRDGA_03305, partial [Bacteroidota bacterium]